jgi:hypothetical protein
MKYSKIQFQKIESEAIYFLGSEKIKCLSSRFSTTKMQWNYTSQFQMMRCEIDSPEKIHQLTFLEDKAG